MIRLRGQMICATEAEAQAVKTHAPAHIAATRAEAGCLLFDITPADDPLIFEVMEAFRTRADFDAHQARTRASDWFAATRHILRDFRLEEVPD